MTDEVLTDGPIQLKPATDDDLVLLMAWRSHPEVYRHFYHQDEPLTWDEHIQFWTTRQDRVDWVIHFDDGTRKRKVGSVNATELSSESPEIGVFIGETTLMGKGVGTRSVRLALEWLKTRGHTRVLARISKENIPSQRLFEKLGFKVCGELHDGAEWMYERIL